MSWAGKILRVNLTAGTVKSEALNMKWAKEYLGSRGLATRYIVENREGTMRPLTQMLNSNDPEVADFAYQYLQANSEATLYPPDDAVKNLLRMSSYVDKKLGSISASRVIDLSILDELGTKRYQRVPR